MKKMIGKKWLVAGATALAMVGTTTGTLVYWASGINDGSGDGSTDIVIGTGEAVDTKVVLGSIGANEKELVPAGMVVDTDNQTDSVVIEFDVTWALDDEAVGDIAGATGVLAIDVTAEIGDGETPADNALVVTNVTGAGAVTFDVEKDVTITVTLTEPANKAQYDRVAGETITLALSFSVEAD